MVPHHDVPGKHVCEVVIVYPGAPVAKALVPAPFPSPSHAPVAGSSKLSADFRLTSSQKIPGWCDRICTQSAVFCGPFFRSVAWKTKLSGVSLCHEQVGVTG